MTNGADASEGADEATRVAASLAEAARGFFAAGFGGVIRVEVIDQGRGAAFWVDGRGARAEVGTNAPGGVEGSFCLWRARRETLVRLFSERGRRVESAFVSNRLMISGDMSVMARLEVGPDAAAGAAP